MGKFIRARMSDTHDADLQEVHVTILGDKFCSEINKFVPLKKKKK